MLLRVHCVVAVNFLGKIFGRFYENFLMFKDFTTVGVKRHHLREAQIVYL